jgi:hypothetical protein
MPDATVTPLRLRAGGGYSDTAALNDIHALLAADSDTGVLADIAVILVRTGRPMVRVRDIEVVVIETALGWPLACTDAGDSTVFVRQDPAGTGLLIDIRTKSSPERDALTVTLDGQPLHPPRQPTDGPA